MKIAERLDRWHYQARRNKWLGYFAVFCRISLAAGFIPSGMNKVIGDRFTDLAVNQPMGNFLEAFWHTGYYYPFVGLMQVLAAILLLIPRTVTLGAFIYLPIILNICILSFALRFDGSFVTAPLMLCAVLFLLCWNYHQFKNIFPFNNSVSKSVLPAENEMTKKFPLAFFAGVALTMFLAIVHFAFVYEIMPRNRMPDCLLQCEKMENPQKCISFCDCIHNEGKPLDTCLDYYYNRSYDDSNVIMKKDTLLNLSFQRTLKVSQQRIFDAFTDPEMMKIWWTPTTSFEIDLKVGGDWKIIRTEGESVFTAQGEYLEINNPGLLKYSYAMPQFSPNTDTITIDIVKQGENTCLVTFTQSGMDIASELSQLEDGSISQSEQGWQTAFDIMAKAWEQEQ